jgi:hypothetical protein
MDPSELIFHLFARRDEASGADVLGAEELSSFLRALDMGALGAASLISSEAVASAAAAGVPLLAASLVARYDSRACGALHLADFLVLLSAESLPGLAGAPSALGAASDAELARVFSAFDSDGEGLLNRHDVRRLIESDGLPATDREVDQVLEEAGDDIGETHMTLPDFISLQKAQGW